MGSAWLIRRFIDPEARFGFVDQPPAPGTAIAFDMFGVEFTHQGGSCTFETLVHRFAIADAAVTHLATIVHDLDLKDARFGAPETAAVGALVDGLQALLVGGSLKILYDLALYGAFRHVRPPEEHAKLTEASVQRSTL